MNFPPLNELFPDDDYRFHLKILPGSPAEFFGPTAHHGGLTEQRKAFLSQTPGRHVALEPAAEPLLEETIALAAEWQTLSTLERERILGAPAAPARCVALGQSWEPDFLLLRPDADNVLRLRGGCVCFPSSWSLEEKMGKPVAEIHDVVPGLNAALGKPIENFLHKLRPGAAFKRSNWGLSASPALNQHPALQLPRLAPPLTLDGVWLRVEHQALVALPRSGGVIFGIRIRVHPLAEVRADADAARRLHRALRTMPEAMARYKGLRAAQEELLSLLEP